MTECRRTVKKVNNFTNSGNSAEVISVAGIEALTALGYSYITQNEAVRFCSSENTTCAAIHTNKHDFSAEFNHQ